MEVLTVKDVPVEKEIALAKKIASGLSGEHGLILVQERTDVTLKLSELELTHQNKMEERIVLDLTLKLNNANLVLFHVNSLSGLNGLDALKDAKEPEKETEQLSDHSMEVLNVKESYRNLKNVQIPVLSTVHGTTGQTGHHVLHHVADINIKSKRRYLPRTAVRIVKAKDEDPDHVKNVLLTVNGTIGENGLNVEAVVLTYIVPEVLSKLLNMVEKNVKEETNKPRAAHLVLTVSGINGRSGLDVQKIAMVEKKLVLEVNSSVLKVVYLVPDRKSRPSHVTRNHVHHLFVLGINGLNGPSVHLVEVKVPEQELKMLRLAHNVTVLAWTPDHVKIAQFLVNGTAGLNGPNAQSVVESKAAQEPSSNKLNTVDLNVLAKTVKQKIVLNVQFIVSGKSGPNGLLVTNVVSNKNAQEVLLLLTNSEEDLVPEETNKERIALHVQ